MVLARASEFMVGEARRAAASQRAGVFGHPGDSVAVSPAPARTTVRAGRWSCSWVSPAAWPVDDCWRRSAQESAG